MKYLFGFIFLFNLQLNSNAHSKSDSISALKIVSNSIDAIGGMEYLKSITTLNSDTKTEMEGRQVHWIVKEMLPNKGSFQILYNNRVMYSEWFDGRKGYKISNGNKRKADKDEFKNKAYKKNIFSELDYLDSALWRLEYLGEEKVESDNCYKVKASCISGLIEILYFNKANFFIVRSDKILNKEKDRFTTCLYGGFKKFGNLTFSTELRFGNEDGKYQYGTVESVLINEGVDNKDFE